MRSSAKLAAACILVVLGSIWHGAAMGADLVILTNQGATPGVKELAAAFSRASGHKVTVIQADDAILQQRVNDGTADLITGNPGPVDELVKNGKVVAGTVTPFVRAGLGLSVQAGAPKPDISTVEAYKATLLAAKSIGYSRGCSGTNIGEGIEQLGLTGQLKNKTIFTTAGPVTDYLARGDFEIGIQQTNIMVGVPGTDYVGPLPGFLNKPCPSSVGLLTNSKQPEAARAMIRFMVSPQAAPLLRKTYVEPAETADHKHELVPFAAPPSAQKIWNLARSVAVDKNGSVIIYRGSEPSVLIYNRAGQLQKAWNLPDGKNIDLASIKATQLRTGQQALYPDAHSVDIDREGFLWLTERSRHIVYKYTMDGKRAMTLGKDGVAGDSASTDAFNRPSDVVVGANGDIFVADDGNFRVVKFSKDGRFLQIIGGVKGTGPGQFGVPHALNIDSKGRLLVLDQHQEEKGKSRVQIFDQNGKFLEQWKLEGDQPTGLVITPDDTVYVADTNGTSITVFKNGKVVDAMRNLPIRPHNLAWDAATSTLYMTEPEGAKERPGGVVLKTTLK